MIAKDVQETIVSGNHEATPLKSLGLRGRGDVFLVGSICVRYITRASRFLRKDAEAFAQIVEAASKVKKTTYRGHIIIEKAPVCSKARLWLEERDMTLETLY